MGKFCIITRNFTQPLIKIHSNLKLHQLLDPRSNCNYIFNFKTFFFSRRVEIHLNLEREEKMGCFELKKKRDEERGDREMRK